MTFQDAGQKIVEGVTAGLYEGASIIMAGADVLVPVQYGTLKRSGQIEEPVTDSDSVSVTCGFGYGASYAARVGEQYAEDPDAQHAYGLYVHEIAVRKSGHVVRHDPPTQAFFLRVPAEALAPDFEAVLAAAIQARLHS